jgi:hypothetical protein|tara:strand:+ start:34 stop:546 length:513 start_codon:yes stop_codon:yes gene_type:complete
MREKNCATVRRGANMTQATKTSRTTRDSATRTKRSFEAPSKLDAPQAPDGIVYTWVRHELLNNPDDANVHESLREGYEIVKPEELGDSYISDVMTTGKHAGAVRSGDLVLMKHDKDYVEEKQQYYEGLSAKAAQAYGHDLKNASHSSMPVEDTSSTSVSGGAANKAKFED